MGFINGPKNQLTTKYKLFCYRFGQISAPGIKYPTVIAISLAKKHGLVHVESWVTFKKGQHLYSAQQIPEAVVCMLSAFELSQKVRPENILHFGELSYHLGRALYDLDDLPAAEKIIKSSLEHPFHKEYYRMQAINTLAVLYSKKNDYPSAIKYGLLALNSTELIENTFWRVLLRVNLAKYYNALHQPQLALDHLAICLEDLNELESNTDVINLRIGYKCEYAQAMEQFGKWNSANIELKEMTTSQLDSASLYSQQRYYQIRSEVYENLGFNRLALLDLRKAKVLSDSLGKSLDQMRQRNTNVRIRAERELIKINETLGWERSTFLYRTVLLMFFMLLLLLLVVIISMRLKGKKIELTLASHQVKMLELEQVRLTEQARKTEEELVIARKELNEYGAKLKQKTHLIDQLASQAQAYPDEKISSALEELKNAVILTNDDWNTFKSHFNKVYRNGLTMLKEEVPKLSPADLRLICLMKLGLDNRQTAHTLGVSIDAVKKGKQRLKHKLTEVSEGALTLELLLERLK